MTDNCNSFVHNIQIATPCKADWNTMSGDEQKRFCEMCKLNVYNIAEMALADVEKLITESEGRVCVRLYRRKDGTVITKDCPVGLKERLMKRVAACAAFLAGCVALAAAWVTNQTHGAGTGCTSLHATMGEVAMPVEQGKPQIHEAMTGSIAPMPIEQLRKQPTVVTPRPTKGSHHD